MKTETKLWLRRKFLMALRAIVWHADDWLHRQEVRLREDLEQVAAGKGTLGACHSKRHQGELREDLLHQRCASEDKASVPAHRETFQQWEARRSGIAVVSKTEARRRRSATEFDLRFAR